MRFYVVDDDLYVIEMIKEIIEEEKLGNVVGTEISSEKAIDDILMLRPNIVILDMLMPIIDGNTLIKTLKAKGYKGKFIMISQVSSKLIIEEAYEYGIEFYISKPINRKEVSYVVHNVVEKILLEDNFKVMKGVFNDIELNVLKSTSVNFLTSEDQLNAFKQKSPNQIEKNIKDIFSKLGIIGEKGCDDLLEICLYLYENNKNTLDFKVKDITQEISDNPKAMEQRLRRTINKGLSNLAYLGIEDYLNDTFTLYSNSIYDFKNVKSEMDYIRGKRDKGGKINIKRFIDNAMILSEK